MRVRRSFAAGALIAFALACPGCDKQEPAATHQSIRFSKVPLVVEVPSDWSQTLNSAQWIMYRPPQGGALLAMSGEKSCSLVEKRVYGALLELGLSEVTWRGAPRQTDIHGLHATLAEGHAVDGNQRSRVKYAIVRAPERQGCLLVLVAVWESRDGELGPQADTILRSVHDED